jgi:hypothetical protein
VLGGMLDGEARDAAEGVARAGFAWRSSVSRDGWATVELTRPI